MGYFFENDYSESAVAAVRVTLSCAAATGSNAHPTILHFDRLAATPIRASGAKGGGSRAEPKIDHAVTIPSSVKARHTCKTTPRGFEPLRAEPNGFLVHHLNHSVTLSHMQRQARPHLATVAEMRCKPNSHASADVDRQLMQQTLLQHEASIAAGSAAYLPHGQPSGRQRGDWSPCGQSPMDF